MDRQIEESVLIERTSEVKAPCLNFISEWAGSKIPGLLVSNPKGLIHSGEGPDDKEGMETFKEAVRRGVKRLQYKTAWTPETGDSETGVDRKVLDGIEEDGENVGQVEKEEKEPPAKRMKEQGSLGEGWDRASPDKCREGKVINVGQVKEGLKGPRKFSELRLKQRKI